MEYTVNRLSKMAGISPRTLRYYDEIGLLKPGRVASSGYRIYGREEVELLQQILFFRELEVPLENIRDIITAADFDREQHLEQHLGELIKKKQRLEALIGNVSKSIANMKGEINMTDKEKFEGFGQALVDENERNYGAEIREKYGEQAVEESNAKLRGMTQEQYAQSEAIRTELETVLKAAFDGGDPASLLAQKACDLHRQWLCVFYPSYSKAYHKGLGELYVADERFRANYDKLAPGCTEFLRDAINVYCGE